MSKYPELARHQVLRGVTKELPDPEGAQELPKVMNVFGRNNSLTGVDDLPLDDLDERFSPGTEKARIA